MNPANTKPTDSFVFHIYDPNNNMIASTLNQAPIYYSPSPANMPEVTVVRQDNTVGAVADPDTNTIDFTV